MMFAAVMLVVVALGSVLFHFLSPWWWPPIASNWQVHRRHDPDHLLDHRRGVRRGAVVHGVLRVPLPPPARQHGELRAREPKARMVADGGDRHRRRGDADAWPVRLEPVHQRSGRKPRRSRSSASNGSGASGLPGPDGKLGSSSTRFVTGDNPMGINPDDPNGKDDVVIQGAELHLPSRQAGQGAAPLGRRAAQFLRVGVPRQNGPRARHGQLCLADADANRPVRDPVRRALRRRASDDARASRGRRGQVDYQAWLDRADRSALASNENTIPATTRTRERHDRDSIRSRRRFRPPMSRTSSSITRTAGSRSTSSRRTRRSSPSSTRLSRSVSASIALVLSWLMRLQLGFPGVSSSSSTPNAITSSSPCTG